MWWWFDGIKNSFKQSISRKNMLRSGDLTNEDRTLITGFFNDLKDSENKLIGDPEAIEKYAKGIDGLKEEVVKYAKSTDDPSISGFSTYLNNAYTSAQNASLGMKALSIGMNLLSTAANMAVMALASFVVTSVIKGISDLIHAQENAIKAGEEAQKAIESANSTYKDHEALLPMSRMSMQNWRLGLRTEKMSLSPMMNTSDF